MALPACATERRAAAQLLLAARRTPSSIDISCPRRAQQQTRRTLLSIDGTDRQTDRQTDGRTDGQTDGQTDGRTLNRFVDPVPHTMRAMSKMSVRVEQAEILALL